jgi:hypothetical protein
MTLIELKAAAYDLLANLEHLQKQLQEVNQKIAEEHQKENNENG